MIAYLDNSATTKPCKQSIEAVTDMLSNIWGNPSSLHRPGIDAATIIAKARNTVADSIGAQSNEIFFTSGGTEANNLAIFGAVNARKRTGNRIVTTAIEHESVLEPIKELEKQGFEVIYLYPDGKGNIHQEQLFEAVDKNTILVSVMYINNEVGTIMPVEHIKRAVKRVSSPALIHIDCVQAYGKIPIKAQKLGADLITISSHKVHGPKGIGALYVNRDAHLTSQNFPRTFGGEQEKKIRPGTEASPLIAGFGKAVECFDNTKKQYEAIKELNTYARQKLSEIDGIIFNNDDSASPYIINVYIPTFMRSQTIIQELSANYDIYVSNGSACAKGKKSHVLSAMGLSDEILDKSIRISFSKDNTNSQVDKLCLALKELINKHPRS